MGIVRQLVHDSVLRQERALEEGDRRLAALDAEWRKSHADHLERMQGLDALVDEIKRGFPPRPEPA